MDIWILSAFRLLWRKLLHSRSSFCVDMFSCFLARINRSYNNYIFDHLMNCQIFFSKVEASFYISSRSVWGLISPHSHQCFLLLTLLILGILMCAKQYLIVVLFLIFLTTNYIECFVVWFFFIVFLLSILLISTLMFSISFLQLTSSSVWSSFSGVLR